MNEYDIERLLEFDVGPNEPKPIVGGGGTGGTQSVTRLDEVATRRRRKFIADLLINGADRHRIIEVATIEQHDKNNRPIPGFPMTEREVDSAIRQIQIEWEEEEADDKRFAKPKAIRRILLEIDEARKDGSFSAVAQLEKVLMSMQGTAEPLEINQQVDNRVTDALLTIMGEMDKARLRLLVDQERARFMDGDVADRPALPPATVSSVQMKRKGKLD